MKSTGIYFQKICLHLLKTATWASKLSKNVLMAPWIKEFEWILFGSDGIKTHGSNFLEKLMTWYDNFLKIEVTLKAYWTLQPFVVKRHEFWATEQFHEIVLTLVFFREKKTFLKSQLTTEVRAALFEERRLIRRSLKAPHFLPSLGTFSWEPWKSM